MMTTNKCGVLSIIKELAGIVWTTMVFINLANLQHIVE